MSWDADKSAKLPIEEIKSLHANAVRLGASNVADLCEAEILKRKPVKPARIYSASGKLNEPVSGFHFVCKNERGVTRNSDGSFWVVSEKIAEDVLKRGGYVALHSSRTEQSYMQDTLKAWRKSARERQYGDDEAQTKFGIDFLVDSTTQAYEWVGDATGEKGYARGDNNSDSS